MLNKRRVGINKAVEKIAVIIEKRLAKLPAAVRDAKLGEIHRIASKAAPIPRERALEPSRTPASHLLARPPEES